MYHEHVHGPWPNSIQKKKAWSSPFLAEKNKLWVEILESHKEKGVNIYNKRQMENDIKNHGYLYYNYVETCARICPTTYFVGDKCKENELRRD